MTGGPIYNVPEFGESRFYRRSWNESRGDAYDSWGSCTYYFWVLNGEVEAQVERYENGVLLAYDRYHLEDEYGFRSTERLEPSEEWDPFLIEVDTYNNETGGQPLNRKG